MQFSRVIAGVMALGAAVAAQAQGVPVFKVGVITATTGAASTIAAPANNAIALYTEQLAAQPNAPFKIEFIRYDDASDPTKSVNLVRKLIQEDGAAMIVCCTTTPSTLAVNKAAEDGQTTVVAMAASASVVEPSSEKRYTFKTPITDRMMVGHQLDYMLKKGVKSLAFMGLEDAYGEGGWVEIKSQAEKKGIKIVATERFARADTNFTPQALKVLQSKADAVYIHAIPPSASLVQEALKRVGYRGPIYHGAGSATNAFIDVGKTSVDGAIVGALPINVWHDLPASNPMAKSIGDFAKAYDAKYGAGKAELFAAQGYDAVALIGETIKRYIAAGKKSTDLAQVRKDLRDELERTKEYAGTVGIFNYKPTDHVGLDERTLFLVQVKNGKFQILKD